ncbi:MAG: DUF2079 domain-containing protein, partial [Planctomycetaceae bacterium]|nr:DUF2079 domain-containing protein [Planctomycetaceae bacterium]
FQLHTILEDALLTIPYFSDALWQSVVEALGGAVRLNPQARLAVTLPSGPLYGLLGGLSLAAWGGGAVVLARIGVGTNSEMLIRWAIRGWRWWLLGALWSAGWLASLLTGWRGGMIFLAKSSPLTLALVLNLWGAEWFALRRESSNLGLCPPVDPAQARRRGWSAVVIAVVLYTIVFTAMNWGLWFNLQIPHGDSAMYEEHLWNVEHGKGFRSYLDQGLFWGEHIQCVHLLLIPLHLLWPSQLLMELCESLALALTALPLYGIALRHSGSPRAAAYLAIAALLYFPLQTLDITIDFKTFRPIAFGVPLLLATIDQLERRRWKTMLLCLLLTLSTKEDFAIPITLLGLWLAVTGGERSADDAKSGRRRDRVIGVVMCLLTGLYLFLAVKVLIPSFRDGGTVHFARYFAKFGETPSEILKNMLTHPADLFGEVFDPPTFLYAVYLLVPLGFLPLLSPGRLLVGLPLFGLLCLNEIAQDPPGPFHHFHAPLLPILFWAAAAGLGRLCRPRTSSVKAGTTDQHAAPVCSGTHWNTAVCGARFALGCAVLTGVWYSLSPLGVRFWDPGRIVAGRPTYWQALYLPDARARAWGQVAPLIPADARVAATDFVHARLTHCERSYDYSRYVRRVAGYEDRVPDDTEYIVIDLQHPYSRSVLGDDVRSAADVRELQTAPGEWELLTAPDDAYFVVLKRRRNVD